MNFILNKNMFHQNKRVKICDTNFILLSMQKGCATQRSCGIDSLD